MIDHATTRRVHTANQGLSGSQLTKPSCLPLNPMECGANYYRHVVSQAVYGQLDYLTWAKLRHWARWRHPRKSTAWAIRRYWHRIDTRLTFATSAMDADVLHLMNHS